MRLFECSWQSGSLLTNDVIARYKEPVSHITHIIKSAQEQHYNTSFASISLLYDNDYFATITDLIIEKQKLKPTAIIVIGIGGSSLGTLAVFNACKPFYTDQQHPEFLCAETVDSDALALMLAHVDSLLSRNNNVLVVVISKSGTTTETVANFLLFEQLLQKHHPHHFNDFVVAITDHNSPLWHYAVSKKYALLQVPALVGGRYSVFSAVGLFPLGMLGIDIKALRQGAQSVLSSCLHPSLTDNPAAITATFLHYHYTQGIAIADFFAFSTYLKELGGWYRQLMGESLGKPSLTDQKPVGITPTISIGTNDLHSVAQLYLGGPKVRTTLFIMLKNTRYQVVIPDKATEHDWAIAVKGKSANTLMHAIGQAIQETYKEQNLPYITITLDNSDVAAIGQFMQYAMVMMMYAGNLLDINPFDQPQVELYKKQTRRILSHE